MAWGRRTGASGLVTAVTPAVTPAEVAAVVDPDAPWVLLTDFGPGLRGWTRARVPLVADQVLEPVTATVRALGFDVLLPTAEFLELAPRLDGALVAGGLLAHQFRVRPTDDVSFGTDAPAGRYRAFGLVVGVNLPHPRENTQLVTLDDAAMDAALARLEGPAAR